MGNKSFVARDNFSGEMTVQESLKRLEYLTQHQHRGRGDTWEAARGRAAKVAGIPASYAARLWHRASDMKDVAGSVYRALLLAYEAQVELNNRIADEHRETRLHLRGPHEADLQREPSRNGMASPEMGRLPQ